MPITSKFEHILDQAREVVANPINKFAAKALIASMGDFNRQRFAFYGATVAHQEMFGAVWDLMEGYMRSESIHRKHVLAVGLKPVLEMKALRAALSDADAATQYKAQLARAAGLAQQKQAEDAATKAAFEKTKGYKD